MTVKERVTCLGASVIVAGSQAPDCGNAASKNLKKITTFQCQYRCGNLEWRCRGDMVKNPTLYKDVMTCVTKLQTGTVLEHCKIESSEHYPWLAAARPTQQRAQKFFSVILGYSRLTERP